MSRIFFINLSETVTQTNIYNLAKNCFAYCLNTPLALSILIKFVKYFCDKSSVTIILTLVFPIRETAISEHLMYLDRGLEPG